MKFLLPLTLTTLLTTALAGNTTLHSTCPFTLYLFHTSPTTVDHYYPIGAYNAPYQTPGGQQMKLSLSNNSSSLYDGSPLTSLAYNVEGEQVYYALSNNNGGVLKGRNVTLRSTEEGCEGVRWTDGKGDEGVKSCGVVGDLLLDLC